MPRDDATLETQLSDQEYVRPPTQFVGQANATDPGIYDRFEATYPDCFEEFAALLDWDDHWDEVLDDSNPPFYEWFKGGSLNASVNCIDRHLEDRKNQTAFVWEGENGDSERIAYQDLYRRVNEMAAVLESVEVAEDDVVTVHLPMIPALPVTMLACARIGAPHSVVFAGFSAQALADRLDDAASDVLVTVDGYYRRGEKLDHKATCDEALDLAETDPETVLLFNRDEALDDSVTIESDDPYVLVEDCLADCAGREVDPVSRDAEDPLFVMYTSGTTGEPKGCQHRTGGYLAHVAWTAKHVLDVKPDDTYWCTADIGWITGHSYIVYGPLALGTTSVMYEGPPDHPHKAISWELCERYDVDIFHTSPTAVRMFMKWGADHLDPYDVDVRHLTTVGEPIQPEAWQWYAEHVGGGDAVVVDTWWQTETGGHMITNLPAIQDMKPGSAGHAVPGVQPTIYDGAGDPVDPASDTAGNLVIERPWPGMLQTVYGDDDRFVSEYWATFSETDSDDPDDWVYKAGDGAVQASDGYFRILGRLDDVMNVAGHRIGTMELESAATTVADVAEAAVTARDDPQKGSVPDVYVVPRAECADPSAIPEAVVEAIESEIGSFARPGNVIVCDALPKTRSGKIMRRLLEDISNGESLGDTTTLRDPSVPEQIRTHVQES
ncbi:acetate--CoA ligase [Halococcoides cellulosivorans]|uniref:Acetate--CoA ligase n=1 Tax=Halococcoides cellulosivorans TaxID=1679096 RepID=A0A2R4WZC2_9EURY|nr:acetate--CoA ligase [Halococcoides cellulosivorans]AWB26881.1 acetate--CoA ligase [Halococcoides cellulosivorans]